MKKVILIFLYWLFFLFLVNKFSIFIIPNRTSYELPPDLTVPRRSVFLPWLNFDGRNYLDIVLQGYFTKGQFDLRVFFPLYPLLIKFFSLNLILNPVIIGLLISWFAFLTGSLLFYRLLKEEERENIAFKSFLLLLLFPSSFFFLAFYTESLFFLLVILAFWFVREEKFLLASITAALASATRIVGLALFPALLWEGYQVLRKKKKFPLSIFVAPLGLLIYLGYTWWATGVALTIFSKHQAWARPIGFLGPYFAIKDWIVKVLAGPQTIYDSPFVYPVIVIELATAIFVAIIIFLSFRKIKISYWIYLLASFIIILLRGVLSALPRYALVLFPMYVYLGKTFSKRALVVWGFVSLFFLMIFSALFLRGYWVG